MYKHVLLIWEPSQRAEMVVTEVGRLLAGTGAQVTVLATETLPQATMEEALESDGILGAVAGLFAASAAATIGKSSAHEFENVKEELQSHLEETARPLREKEIPTDCVVQFGDLASVILDYARTHDVDAIIMSTSWSGELKHIVSDGTAKRLLEAGVIPLVVVPLPTA